MIGDILLDLFDLVEEGVGGLIKVEVLEEVASKFVEVHVLPGVLLFFAGLLEKLNLHEHVVEEFPARD